MGFLSCAELLAVYAWSAVLKIILCSVKKHVVDISLKWALECRVIAWMLALYFSYAYAFFRPKSTQLCYLFSRAW